MERRSSLKMVCRKDMQCTCPMCLASFQATWDLRRPLPLNNAFQSITNLEDNYDYRTPTPPQYRKGKENDTPKSLGNDEKVCRPVTPFLPLGRSHLSFESTGGLNSPEKKEGIEKSVKTISPSKWRRWLKTFACVVILVLVAFVLLKVLFEVQAPALSKEKVVAIVEESLFKTRLGDRFDLIQRKLAESLPGQVVSNCTGSTAIWNLKDAGYLVHSECKFFSSAAESVTVWGLPVKTSGILGRAVRDRSFTVISGRLYEWQEGQVEYEIRNEGQSWIFPQWAASTIHMEANTWIVEYKEGVLSGLESFSGIAQFFKHRVRKWLLDSKGAFDASTLGYSRLIYKVGTEIMPT